MSFCRLPQPARFAKLARMSMVFFRSKRNSIFTTVVFGAIILTFILWGGYSHEGSSATSLTTVNGDEISNIEFQRLLNRQLEVYGQFMGGGKKLSDQIVQLVERQIASGLVMRKVMAQKAASMGIVVGDEEIIKTLEKNTAFQDPTLKRFSPTVYQAVLEANNLKPSSFESGLREELASEKMKDLLEQSITVSDKEIEEAYRIQSQTMTLDIASLNAQKLIEKKKITVTDKAIEDHFAKHQAEYLSSERRTALFANLELGKFVKNMQVSDAEIEELYNSKVKDSKEPQWSEPRAHAYHILIADSSDKGLKKSQALLKTISTLDDFTSAAQKNSEDYSNASKGGDLGYFNDKAMVKPFSEAVFSKAKIGAAYGPVKTDFGYHLIWVVDRSTASNELQNRKNEIAYSIRQTKGREQLESLKKELDQKLKGSKSDITESLRSKGFDIFESPEFDAKSRLEKVPYVIIMDAMKAPTQEWQGPTEHDGSLYFYKVNKNMAPQPLSLAEARTEIVKRLQTEELEKFAKSIDERLKKGLIKWEQLASEGAEISSQKSIKPFQLTEIPGLGQAETLIQAAQKLKESEPISNPLFHESNWIILRGSQWSAAPASIPDTDKNKIRDELISKKRTSILDSYVQGLVKTAKIPESFRKKYNL